MCALYAGVSCLLIFKNITLAWAVFFYKQFSYLAQYFALY